MEEIINAYKISVGKEQNIKMEKQAGICESCDKLWFHKSMKFFDNLNDCCLLKEKAVS
jgi:hypothetical protein